MQKNTVELGCGLIGIGRVWGVKESRVPSEQEALTFLNAALAQSIRFFDTAPSYGLSEERLGKWLKTLNKQQRQGIIVATKFGEHWSNERQQPFVSHEFDVLSASLNQSLLRLGKIDVLQLHKTNPTVLKNDGVKRALEYAKEKGIQQFGASVSDVESGEMVCEDDRFTLIQLPFNQENTIFTPIIREATRKGKLVVTNRPFNMGAMVNKEGNKTKTLLEQEAFQFILTQFFNGFILTGTKSPDHLRENIEAFDKAKDSIS